MISLADLKAQLRITTNADDEVLKNLLERAAEYIERETGWYFGTPRTITEVVRGRGTRDLWLSDNVAQAPTTVVEEPLDADPLTITGADSNGFVVRGRKLVRKPGYIWTRGYEYSVTYKRGYAGGSAPGWAEQAVIRFVSLHRAPEDVTSGIKSETISGYSYTLADSEDVRSDEAALRDFIRPYRREYV